MDAYQTHTCASTKMTCVNEEAVLTYYQLFYLVLICRVVHHISVLCWGVKIANSGSMHRRRATRLRA